MPQTGKTEGPFILTILKAFASLERIMDRKEAEKGIQIRISGGKKAAFGGIRYPKPQEQYEGRRQDHEKDFKRQKR